MITTFLMNMCMGVRCCSPRPFAASFPCKDRWGGNTSMILVTRSSKRRAQWLILSLGKDAYNIVQVLERPDCPAKCPRQLNFWGPLIIRSLFCSSSPPTRDKFQVWSTPRSQYRMTVGIPFKIPKRPGACWYQLLTQSNDSMQGRPEAGTGSLLHTCQPESEQCPPKLRKTHIII